MDNIQLIRAFPDLISVRQLLDEHIFSAKDTI